MVAVLALVSSLVAAASTVQAGLIPHHHRSLNFARSAVPEGWVTEIMEVSALVLILPWKRAPNPDVELRCLPHPLHGPRLREQAQHRILHALLPPHEV